MPFTEPISLPAENSADDLVDLPPVPLVEAAPALESAETYITVPLQESPARELPLLGVSEPPLIDDVPVVEDSRESPVVAASVLSFGSTPGPELALSASVPANIEKTEEHPQPAEVFAADPDARVESKESTGSSYYADLEVTNSIIGAFFCSSDIEAV
ncbi:hypothetical protein BDZ97DRAFT_1041450 [Flammula alnicola]|nr:hypothetical protein BDZ97DRAFT_1041450 [Flammula alnicola]